MHEVSVMGSIIAEILRIAREKSATRVHSVFLEIGEFALLGSRQLKFAFDILSKSSGEKILRGAKMTIRTRKGKVRCAACNYAGPLARTEKIDHRFPVFCCPKCGGKVELTQGRDCIIRSLKLEVAQAPAERQPLRGTGNNKGSTNRTYRSNKRPAPRKRAGARRC